MDHAKKYEIRCKIIWNIRTKRLAPFSRQCNLRFLSTKVLQGSVPTRVNYDRIFIDCFTANLLQSVLVKEFWKSVSISQSYRQKIKWHLFFGHGVYGNSIKLLLALLAHVKFQCWLSTYNACSHSIWFYKTNKHLRLTDWPTNGQTELSSLDYVNETSYKYSPRENTLLKRVSKLKVKGQGWDKTNWKKCKIKAITAFKVVEVGTNQKPVCDFLLVINSN